ncbi:MAG: L-threonylcarbamoyladenylate synthase [Cyanobacteria bacterium J06627_15]
MPKLTLSQLPEFVRSGVISFPTDTVAAISTLPPQGQRLYELKQRSPDKPLILMGATAADLWPYVIGNEHERATWTAVVEQHWPGPLTLVLPASERLPKAMNPTGSGTIGIRVPDHPVARRVLAETGPLATTSANRSGQPALMQAAQIAAAFPTVGLLDSVIVRDLQAGQPLMPSGIASTVAKWTGNGWQIIRQGTIHL